MRTHPTHREHAESVRPAVPCAAWHVNFGGGCLNCGWTPEPTPDHGRTLSTEATR